MASFMAGQLVLCEYKFKDEQGLSSMDVVGVVIQASLHIDGFQRSIQYHVRLVSGKTIQTDAAALKPLPSFVKGQEVIFQDFSGSHQEGKILSVHDQPHHSLVSSKLYKVQFLGQLPGQYRQDVSAMIEPQFLKAKGTPQAFSDCSHALLTQHLLLQKTSEELDALSRQTTFPSDIAARLLRIHDKLLHANFYPPLLFMILRIRQECANPSKTNELIHELRILSDLFRGLAATFGSLSCKIFEASSQRSVASIPAPSQATTGGFNFFAQPQPSQPTSSQSASGPFGGGGETSTAESRFVSAENIAPNPKEGEATDILMKNQQRTEAVPSNANGHDRQQPSTTASSASSGVPKVAGASFSPPAPPPRMAVALSPTNALAIETAVPITTSTELRPHTQPNGTDPVLDHSGRDHRAGNDAARFTPIENIRIALNFETPSKILELRNERGVQTMLKKKYEELWWRPGMDILEHPYHVGMSVSDYTTIVDHIKKWGVADTNIRDLRGDDRVFELKRRLLMLLFHVEFPREFVYTQEAIDLQDDDFETWESRRAVSGWGYLNSSVKQLVPSTVSSWPPQEFEDDAATAMAVVHDCFDAANASLLTLQQKLGVPSPRFLESLSVKQLYHKMSLLKGYNAEQNAIYDAFPPWYRQHAKPFKSLLKLEFPSKRFSEDSRKKVLVDRLMLALFLLQTPRRDCYDGTAIYQQDQYWNAWAARREQEPTLGLKEHAFFG